MSDFNCLALETSSTRSTVAACHGKKVVSLELADSKTSSRLIYKTVQTVLDEAGLSFGHLNAIAYGCGPGNFTGVRVAASAVQGLAFTRSLPVARVSSLESLACQVGHVPAGGCIAASLDARMGEAYVGVYRVAVDGRLENISADRLVEPQQFRLADVYPQAVAAGPGWKAFPEMLTGFGGDVSDDVWPDAAAVLAVANRQYLAGELLTAAEALPNYVRDKVTHN